MESLFVPLLFVAFPVATAMVGAGWAWRAATSRRRRSLLIGFAFALIGVPLAFFVLMLVGESISDLGPGVALAMLGPWALAAIAYLTLAWIRPDLTLRLVGMLAVIPIGLALWSATDPVAFGAWQDRVGPMNLIVSQFLIAAAAMAGLRRPRGAGVLVVVVAGVTAAPPLASFPREAFGGLVIASLSLPALLAGVLLILAGTPRFGRPARGRADDAGRRPMAESDAATRSRPLARRETAP